MKVFRGRDKKLYTIEFVRPRMYTGSWYEVTPLFGGKTKRVGDIQGYQVVGER